MKYAVMVPFGPPDDDNSWMYVTDTPSTGDFNELFVVTHDSYEAADKAGKTWRLYKVVEYNKSPQE